MNKHWRFHDVTGQIYERLTVLRRVYKPNDRRTYWACQCTCGTECIVEAGALKAGLQKSCGCLRAELVTARRTTHGATKGGLIGREYRAWRNAKSRCFYPKNIRYPSYGGRGITMFDRWRDSFEDFLADMGPCPDGCTIDRINNDGHYEPGNCRWATFSEQMANQRKTLHVTFEGESMALKTLARRTGVPYLPLWKAVRQHGEDPAAAVQRLRD